MYTNCAAGSPLSISKHRAEPRNQDWRGGEPSWLVAPPALPSEPGPQDQVGLTSRGPAGQLGPETFPPLLKSGGQIRVAEAVLHALPMDHESQLVLLSGSSQLERAGKIAGKPPLDVLLLPEEVLDHHQRPRHKCKVVRPRSQALPCAGAQDPGPSPGSLCLLSASAGMFTVRGL